ncbi:MAG: hypothetical protein FJY73_13540 [Candidatus Eisenbacteria bacterium]|nr:hypothetical protein [Candidatus Eisenbacteria bacterium]
MTSGVATDMSTQARAERQVWYYPSDHKMLFDGLKERDYSSKAAARSWGALDGVIGGVFGGVLTGGVAALASKHAKEDAFWKWSTIGAGVIAPLWILDNISAVRPRTVVTYRGAWVDPFSYRLVKREGKWLDPEEIAWADACAIDTPEATEQFLAEFPASPLRVYAAGRLEQQLWSRIQLSSKEEEWESFLRRFPNGKHCGEARKRIEWLAWITAMESDTRASYGDYLKRFPAGEHAVEASARMAELKREREKALLQFVEPGDSFSEPKGAGVGVMSHESIASGTRASDSAGFPGRISGVAKAPESKAQGPSEQKLPKPPENRKEKEPPLRTTSELAPGFYDSKTDDPAPVAEISLFGEGGGLATAWKTSPMFENTRHVFVGEMTTFIRAMSQDGRAKVISAAHPSYDPSAMTNPPLSGVGVVYLDDKGIVKGDNAKSGWLDMVAWGKYTNRTTGKTEDVKFTGVSFWVNRSGRNWWQFRVAGAVSQGENAESLEISTHMEELGGGTKRPVILVEGKYRLIPQVTSLGDITFVEHRK